MISDPIMTPGPKGWFYMIRNWADRDTLDRDAVITACNQAIDEMNRSETIELKQKEALRKRIADVLLDEVELQRNRNRIDTDSVWSTAGFIMGLTAPVRDPPDREALIGVINEWAKRGGCWLGSAFGPQFRMAVKESLADRILELFGAKK